MLFVDTWTTLLDSWNRNTSQASQIALSSQTLIFNASSSMDQRLGSAWCPGEPLTLDLTLLTQATASAMGVQKERL